MKCGFRSNEVCHHCTMMMRDIVQHPNPVPQSTRRTLENFLEEALKPGEKSSMAEIMKLFDSRLLNPKP